MPSPLAHSLAGLAVWAVARKPVSVKEAFTRENAGWAALCVSAANLPDLDFISINSSGIKLTELYHHGATHSAGFAAAIGGAMGLWAWLRKKTVGQRRDYFSPDPVSAGAIAFICVLLHVTLDLFSVDSNPVNGIGLPILWPATGEYYVIPLMGAPDRSDPFSIKTVIAVAEEAVIFSGVLLAALAYGRRRGAAMEREGVENRQAPVAE